MGLPPCFRFHAGTGGQCAAGRSGPAQRGSPREGGHAPGRLHGGHAGGAPGRAPRHGLRQRVDRFWGVQRRCSPVMPSLVRQASFVGCKCVQRLCERLTWGWLEMCDSLMSNWQLLLAAHSATLLQNLKIHRWASMQACWSLVSKPYP